jgi:putative transcription factor
LFKVKIEESVLDVCESCLSFGEQIMEPKPVKTEKKEVDILSPYEEEETFFVENYGKIIIETREKKGLTREEFAEKIKEKESVIKRIENGKMTPDDTLTNKIEKFLEIKLKRPYERKYTERKIKKAELTIGDIVEVE